jgi:hypothetical protein
LFAKGGESLKRALKTLFLAINAKGGESISPKQKDRTTTPISKFSESCFQLVFFKLVFLKEILSQLAYFKEEVFKNWDLKHLTFFQFVKPS